MIKYYQVLLKNKHTPNNRYHELWKSHSRLFEYKKNLSLIPGCILFLSKHHYYQLSNVLSLLWYVDDVFDTHWLINKGLTGGNWQKWKRVFLTCPYHEIYRDEAVVLKSCKYTWKITIFVKMRKLGQYRENLIFCE